MPVTLYINQDRYVLDPEADVDRLRSAVVAASRAGGDLVQVVHRRGVTDALVTPVTHVRIDYVPDPEERQGDDDDEDLAFADFDLE